MELMLKITCEAKGRDGTEPALVSGHGVCSLTLLTTSSVTSGPANWRAVTPLMLTINPYMMQQKQVSPRFFRVVE